MKFFLCVSKWWISQLHYLEFTTRKMKKKKKKATETPMKNILLWFTNKNCDKKFSSVISNRNCGRINN